MEKPCPQFEYVAGRQQLVAQGNQPGHHALFALANGRCGIIGSIDECAMFPDLLLPGGYVSRPIHYHEAFPGYATATDTKVKCPSPVYFTIKLDGEAVAFDKAICEENVRRLDLASGILFRTARWRLADGRCFEIRAERLVPVDGDAMVASSIKFRPVNFSAHVILQPDFGHSGPVSLHDDDPRISGAAQINWEYLPEKDGLFRFRGSECEFACRQKLENAEGGPVANGNVEGDLSAGQALAFHRIVAFAFGRDGEEAILPAGELPSYDELKRRQAEHMARATEDMAVHIDGDGDLAGAINFNLWHLLQSASRDPAHSIAAKGLTGEGYEGHYFWDTEIFMLPALAVQRPDLARNLILYRASVLDRARDHARSLGHRHGALYPWRTIAGRECSSHYPTGSAQYHINGDIAYAVEFLHSATGDEAFLFDHCAEMLFETARLWMEVGAYSDRHGGDFCIFGVTGPDEYSAFVDNDHYTNAIARRHLLFAATTARRMAELLPQAFGELAKNITLTMEEIEGWEQAATCMHLPLDSRLGISPQDDAFLSKPFWPEGKWGREYGPLLLRHHPMELFRHQICKQGDVVQAMSLNLHSLPLTVKERNFAYYEAITTHDSTLSPVAFATAAIEIGEYEKALAYHRECAFVDLEDIHGNSAHGLHVAAISGSWLVMAQGWAGMRVDGGLLHFHPTIPDKWRSYDFRMRWRGNLIELIVNADGTTYHLIEGEGLDLLDHGRPVRLRAEPRFLSRSAINAVIFDLDGVLTDTAQLHYLAWNALSERHRLRFDPAFNEKLKGVDRSASLRLILENSDVAVGDEKFADMLAEKNDLYRRSLDQLGSKDLFPDILPLFDACRAAGLKIALASASKNAREVLDRLGIADRFDYIADAARIGRQKPAPDIFVDCARQMGLEPRQCVGVEDAQAGVAAIHAANMAAIGVGDPLNLPEADFHISQTGNLRVEDILKLGELVRVQKPSPIHERNENV